MRHITAASAFLLSGILADEYFICSVSAESVPACRR
jgi:hypothetical protein